MCNPSNVDRRPSQIIESISSPSPRRYPKRAFFKTYGAFVIDSMPPVTTSSTSPARIIESAISTARIEDAQTLLIVSAGTSIGMPPPTAACRAGAWPAPPCSTWPMITYSTSLPSSPARIAIAPSCVASYAFSAPPRRPKGVRTAETMTVRLMSRGYSRLPGERRAGLEALSERHEQPHHGLDVVELHGLDGRVH